MYNYLRDVLNFPDTLTEKQTKEIFIKIIKDYFGKKIDIATLSNLSSLLLFEIVTPDIINNFKDDLFSKALDYAADIRFYAENKDLGENRKTYTEFMKTIKEYYKKT